MKKMSIALVLMAVLPISLLIAGVHASVGWSRWYNYPVDTTGNVGYDNSIALDFSGNPHISYLDFKTDPYLNSDLKYARFTGPGGGWSTETVDSAGDVGYRSSIAVDSSGRPHISYDSGDNLKYATWTGSAWSIQTVDSAGIVGLWSAIALDSSGNPHISYLDFDQADLKYATWTGSAWSIQTVDSPQNVGWWSSIAVDSSSNPHISYFDYTNHDLKYARWTGAAWSIQTVDSAGDLGYGSSIALDSSGNPHISYGELTSPIGNLKYARWTGSAWSIQTADSSGDVDFQETSIALDSGDNPHITYADISSGELKYTRWTGAAWNIETVDSVPGFAFWHSDVSLDSSDVPHISYRDNTNEDLKYASLLVPINMWSSDSLGNPKDVFVPGETVYVTCPRPRTFSTSVTLFVVADHAAWNDGDPLLDVSGGAELESIVWGASGSTQSFGVWTPPLVPGSYDIVMDKDNDAVFDAGLDLVDSMQITGFNVIPEVPFGTAMTFLSMFIAFVGFLGFKRLRPKIQLQFRKTA